ncbi:MAG: hypothetical protein R3B07_00325 [Polyangiaceae bacterium]
MKKLLGCCMIAGIAVACSSEPAGKSTSTVSGQLSVTSYPSAVSQVVAQDETGHLVGVGLDSSGRFKLDLKKGHKYRLGVTLANSEVPVVFPRVDASLGQWIDVQSGGAVANLGMVTYYGALPATGFKVTSADGECENGVDATTGAPCVDEEGDVQCEDGANDGECENGVDVNTGAACTDAEDVSDGDGECVDGVDATTGAACTDAPDASDGDMECENGVDVATGAACVDVEDASGEGPMAVAEHNAPSVLGGCDDGEEAD